MTTTRHESTDAPNGVDADERSSAPAEPSLEEQTDALLADIERDADALQRLGAEEPTPAPAPVDDPASSEAETTPPDPADGPADEDRALADQLDEAFADAQRAVDETPAPDDDAAHVEADPQQQPETPPPPADEDPLDAGVDQMLGAAKEQAADAPSKRPTPSSIEELDETLAREAEARAPTQPDDDASEPAHLAARRTPGAAERRTAPASAPTREHPTPGGVAARLTAAADHGQRAKRLVLASARIVSAPLVLLPPTVRDYLGWFGIVTAFNAICLWLYFILVGA